jgi:hypothetical protein
MNLNGSGLTGIGSSGIIEHIDLAGQPIELTEESQNWMAETAAAAGLGLAVKAILINTT